MTRQTLLVVLLAAACKPSDQAAPIAVEAVRISVFDAALDAYDIDRAYVGPLTQELMQVRSLSRVLGWSAQGHGGVVVEWKSARVGLREGISERAHQVVSHAEIASVPDSPRINGYVVHAPHLDRASATQWHDRVAREALQTIVGVTKVAVCGSAATSRSIEIRLEPKRLAAAGTSVRDLIAAMRDSPDHVDELRTLPVKSALGSILLSDLATFEATTPDPECRAYGSAGAVLSVDVYGDPAARDKVTSAIEKLATTDIQIEQRPNVQRYLLAAVPPEGVPALMANVEGAVARIDDPSLLPGETLLEVDAAHDRAVREQLSGAGVFLQDTSAPVLLLTAKATQDLTSVAGHIAVQLGAREATTTLHRWVHFDSARIATRGLGISSGERSWIQDVVSSRVRVGTSAFMRIAGNPAELLVTMYKGQPVLLSDVALIETGPVPHTIWRLEGRPAIALRPPASAPRRALERLAEDQNGKLESSGNLRR